MQLKEIMYSFLRDVKRVGLLVFLVLFTCELSAQGYSIYEDTQFDMLQRQMYRVGEKRLHPSLRSYSLDELNSVFSVDSVLYAGFCKPEKSDRRFRNLCRDLLWDDFVSLDGKHFHVNINPMFDLSIGKADDKKSYLNSRGFYINGNFGKNFWFYMDFSENQLVTTDYESDSYNSSADKQTGPQVLGKTNAKILGNAYDYEVADGYIGWRIGSVLDFQLGKSKVFIGDGYRSLLLSDVASSYPMFRVNATFSTVKYMFMIAQLRAPRDDIEHEVHNGVYTKYSITHYLDVNLGKRFNIGLFENVIQCSWRANGDYRGFDFEYLNPFVVFRPGESNAGSPDKMLVGMNMSFKVANWFTLHGQAVLNEFRLQELKNHKDWWANKYGFLAGIKTFNLFRIDGLDMQFEWSRVRPFTYSQYTGMATYTHAYTPLAHPLGANFQECLGILQYRHKRLYMRAQINAARHGEDVNYQEDNISYGGNPNRPSNNRPSEYDNKMFQGLDTRIKYQEAQVAFLINPRTRLNVALTYRHRTKTNDLVDESSNHVSFALRWGIKNWYHDY